MPPLPDRPHLVRRQALGPGSMDAERALAAGDTDWVAASIDAEAATQSLVIGWDDEERQKAKAQEGRDRPGSEPRASLLPAPECRELAAYLPITLPILSLAIPLLAGVAHRCSRLAAEKLAPGDRWLQAPAAHRYLGNNKPGSDASEQPFTTTHLAAHLWVATGLTRARVLAIADLAYDGTFGLLARRFAELCRLEREAEVEALTRGSIDKQLRLRIAGAREAVRVADDAAKSLAGILDRSYCPPPQPTMTEDDDSGGQLVLQLWQGGEDDGGGGSESLRDLYGDETTAGLYRELVDLRSEFPSSLFPVSAATAGSGHHQDGAGEGGPEGQEQPEEGPGPGPGPGPSIDLSWEAAVNAEDEGTTSDSED